MKKWRLLLGLPLSTTTAANAPSAGSGGSRCIAGGRDRVRKSLYAAALPATFQWNPVLLALYGRPKTAGKPHKLALVACARKLLIFANTMLTRQTPWTPKKPAEIT
ncbi:MAG: hypothetical protein WBE62_08625 [Methylocella sp.]